MKLSENLQKLLPFGYLFLVVIGILKESVFFYQIGINILKYSSIMDILISPIATLTSNPIILVAVIIVTIFCYAYPTVLAKRRNKKWAQKLATLKNEEDLNEEKVETHFTKIFVLLFAFALISFFLGIGIGEGIGLKKKIKGNKLTYNRTLTYGSGEAEEVYLISTNSVYFFYLSKGSNAVKIAPIGAIKHIDLTKNKMLDQ